MGITDRLVLQKQHTDIKVFLVKVCPCKADLQFVPYDMVASYSLACSSCRSVTVRSLMSVDEGQFGFTSCSCSPTLITFLSD